MLDLENVTPFQANYATQSHFDGSENVTIIVKASFDMASQLTLVNPQPELQDVDEYYAEPGLSSIAKPTEFTPLKPNSDIMMIGSATSPNSQPVTQFNVDLQVGKLSKTVTVFGDRIWRNGFISQPQPFVSMPVVYERAYGGRHEREHKPLIVQPQNPVGVSFCGKRSKSDFNDTPLPNIEMPRRLMSYYRDNPMPQGFAPCSGDWQSRVQYAGTYDEQWQQRRAPFLPDDFDTRFYNMAHPDLIYDGYLQGGEQVRINNMHVGGPINFVLPQLMFRCEITEGKHIEDLEMHLETLMLYPNDKYFSVIYKANYACQDTSQRVEHISVSMRR